MRTTSLHIKDIEQRPTTAYSRDMHDVNEIKQMATHGAGVMVLEATGAQLWGALKGLCPDIQHTATFSPTVPPVFRSGSTRPNRLVGASATSV